MTLLAELIDIPEHVHKSDFVISLKTAIEEPQRTMDDYVVTKQLAESFDKALSLVTTSLGDGKSKSTYLHASFGAGKSAFMAVTHLLLQGHPAARSNPDLAPLVVKYGPRLDGKRFLLVPYQAVGASSLEQIVLGGYVEYVSRLQPGQALPVVYVADGILDDTVIKRGELGDDVFFRVLSEGDAADEWGAYGAGWDAVRFEAALASGPGSSERDQLLSALVRTHYRALPGQAQATSEGFVPIEAGLEAISRHAKALGYDAVILFLDELVLWLASRMSDVAFVAREGAKVVKLVEADAARRPVPIVSFIARQRDLRELVGDNVPGAQSLTAVDILRHSEGRFGTITLEDRNLPLIAEKRLLRPRSEAARQLLDDAFEVVRRQVEERGERDVLLTDTGDLAAFRRLYPFSPALVDALVALSGAMQRERTALKVMLQLLVEGRAHLQVGQLVPLGDLFDVINAGDEPLTEVMRAQFAQARRLWTMKFQPLLLRDHSLDEDGARTQPPGSPYVTDARLVKSLLIAALVPEVGPLRALTVSRLTALNSGVVRAFVPGTERQQVLDRLRRWSAEVGELKVGDDDHDPTVSIQLTGVDTGPILDAAKIVDNDGERRRRVRELLTDALEVKDIYSTDPWLEVTWRGTRRRVSVLFGNVRDRDDDIPDESLRAGNDPKIVIDFPWDADGWSPADDRARIDEFRRDRSPEWTCLWLPNFFTLASRQMLGKLVRLDYVLNGDNFDRLAGHLSPTDKPIARTQLSNEQSAVRDRVMLALRQAYGVDTAQDGVVEPRLSLADQFATLDPGLAIQPPVGTSMRSCVDGLADQLFSYRYPKHPRFTELISLADLRHTLAQVVAALQEPNGRMENVDPTMRRVLTRVANPLGVGTMYPSHFIADLGSWKDLIERRRAMAGLATVTVRNVRAWLEGAETPVERRGLTTEVSDLVLLCVAADTNRVLLDGGRPVTKPEIGKLRDDWELKAQDLPAADVWAEAVRRAGDMGAVPISTMLSVTTVADLNGKIHTEIVGDRGQAVRELVARLEAAYVRLAVEPESPRLRTAKAAVELIEALRKRPDHAIDALAKAVIPTSAAALGSSIVKTQGVLDELDRTNWDLIRSATSLTGEWAATASMIAGRLREALAADELTTALVPKLRDAVVASTKLLDDVVRPPQPPPPGADFNAVRRARRADAEAKLADLRARLRQEAHMKLTWIIEDVDDPS